MLCSFMEMHSLHVRFSGLILLVDTVFTLPVSCATCCAFGLCFLAGVTLMLVLCCLEITFMNVRDFVFLTVTMT